jgi:hypothetical protein
MDELPDWEPGTAAVLSVIGPHAIPLSTAVRTAPDRIAFALARRRETLARLRDDPAAAICLMAPGMALTAYGAARVVREELEASPHVAALELRVERIQDHLAGSRTAIDAPVRWRWTEDAAAEADAAVRAEVAALR